MQLFAAEIMGYPDSTVFLVAGIIALLVGGSAIGILVLALRRRLSKARSTGEEISN